MGAFFPSSVVEAVIVFGLSERAALCMAGSPWATSFRAVCGCEKVPKGLGFGFSVSGLLITSEVSSVFLVWVMLSKADGADEGFAGAPKTDSADEY